MDKHNTPSAHIRWDDITIDRETVYLPEELRDGYRWLKTYVRDVLARDLDRLIDAFRKQGIYHDKTSWAKILRGRWNRNAQGGKLPSPVLRAENVAIAIEALRSNTRAESLRGEVPFVMTSTAQRIFDYIDLKRAPGRVNRFGIVVGPTGAQKTASFKEYRRQRNHGSTDWIEAPENGALGEFVTRLAGDLAVKTSTDKKRAHLLKSIRSTRCIIIDNCQDLYRPEWQDRQPAFSYMRRLQDETGCAIILSITPTFERVLAGQAMAAFFEQFEGRSGGQRNWLRLPEYAPDEDVVAIAEAFRLVDAKKHLKYLVKISREPGRIRRLFEDLQDARMMAGDGDLEIDHLREARGEETGE